MIYETNKEIISVREAARECGRNAETVRRWIWDGKLPAEKLGNQLFIKKKDLALYCRETAVQYRAEPKADFVGRAFRKQMKMGLTKPSGAAGEIRKMREKRKNKLDQSLLEGETNMKTGNRANLIKRMRKLREEIRARTGKTFNAESMIRDLRDERDSEVR